jgi:hypothetical protein
MEDGLESLRQELDELKALTGYAMRRAMSHRAARITDLTALPSNEAFESWLKRNHASMNLTQARRQGGQAKRKSDPGV